MFGSLGSIASGLVGAVGDIGGSLLQNEFNKGRMKDQYAYQKELYENRYQWQMEDMRKAGYNPMLSAHTGVGSAGSVGLPGSSAPQAGSSAVAGYRADQQNRLIRQQIKESQARTALVGNQAQNEWFKIGMTAYDVHTAKAKMEQEQSVARAYEKFGPSGLARILELFPSLSKTLFEGIPRKQWGPRSSIFPSEGRGRSVGPPPSGKKKKPRYRNPDKPWLGLRREK